MAALSADEVFLFEGFRLDRRAGGLFRVDENGVSVPVAIGSRALDLLILLVTRHGELVSKDEIMTAVWPGTVIEDSNLSTHISALRRVLDREQSRTSCIQTVSGRGYRFVEPVTHAAAASSFAPPTFKLLTIARHGRCRSLQGIGNASLLADRDRWSLGAGIGSGNVMVVAEQALAAALN